MSVKIGALETMLDESRVAEFLQQHPDFFLRHKALLDDMTCLTNSVVRCHCLI
jgi:uncharacterized protein YigA (DUF484 family)